jgi:hypothetical protein
MYPYVSIMSIIAVSIAADNFFFDDGYVADFDAESERTWDPPPLNDIEMATPSFIEDFQSMDEYIIYNNPTEPFDFGVNQYWDESPETWTALSSSEHEEASWNWNAEPGDCSSSGQDEKSPISDRAGIKSRNDAVCRVEAPAGFPDDFRNLDDSKTQQEIFNKVMCPSTDPSLLTASIPVCSSKDPANTHLGNPNRQFPGHGYYTLVDATLCAKSLSIV